MAVIHGKWGFVIDLFDGTKCTIAKAIQKQANKHPPHLGQDTETLVEVVERTDTRIRRL